MQLVNLTSHPIYDVTTGTSVPASGVVARIKTNTTVVNRINEIPVYRSECTAIEGLPEPADGYIYIVSALVLEHTPSNRTDVVAPGNVQKNRKGEVIGCQGFKANR